MPPDTHFIADFPYHSHQYTPYPLAYDEGHLGQTIWGNRQYTRSDSGHGYPPAHPYHFSPETGAPDYTSITPSTSGTRHYSPLALGGEQGGQSRVAALQSLQPSPYVPTVPPSPSEGSSYVHSPADPGSSPHTYLSHAELDQHATRAFTGTAEPVNHPVETPQFIVPSSRISRAEPSPYSPTGSQLAPYPGSHPSQPFTETKPKRRRANADQLSLLNDTYARTMFPTTEERTEIGRRINMTPRQVQIWYVTMFSMAAEWLG